MKFMKHNGLLLLLIAMTVTASAACSSSDVAKELTEGTWSLVEFGQAGSMVAAVGEATINFDGDTDEASGSTGCNSFFGDYSVGGDSISFNQVAATEQACMDPPGVMEQEGEFLRILAAVTSFKLEGDELRLISPDSELRFTREGD